MLFAMTAAPLIDRALYGPSMESLKGENFGDNPFDNLERYGTTGNYKDSQGYVPPQADAGNGIKAGNFDDLPSNAQNSYKGYEGNGWQGNYSGQTPGTNAGRAWYNELGDFPTIDRSGKQITYREFDVNNRIPGAARDSERFLVGSDGSVYYTLDHYETFIRIR